MIRGLRREFVLTNLLLVDLVLAVVFGILLGSNTRPGHSSANLWPTPPTS